MTKHYFGTVDLQVNKTPAPCLPRACSLENKSDKSLVN